MTKESAAFAAKGTPEVTLLPCPFCGGDELSHGWSSPGYDGSMHSGSAECHSCGALIIAETEAEAIAAWNTRATTADLQARLEAAEGRIAGLVEGLALSVSALCTARKSYGEHNGIWADVDAAIETGAGVIAQNDPSAYPTRP